MGLERWYGGIISIVAVQEQFGLMLLGISETDSDALGSLQFEVNNNIYIMFDYVAG